MSTFESSITKIKININKKWYNLIVLLGLGYARLACFILASLYDNDTKAKFLYWQIKLN